MGSGGDAVTFQVRVPTPPAVVARIPSSPAVVRVATGATGPAGPRGEAGISGFEYTQTVAAATWTIPHALGRRPSVEVYAANERVMADIDASTTSVTITFAAPVSGSAVLS